MYDYYTAVLYIMTASVNDTYSTDISHSLFCSNPQNVPAQHVSVVVISAISTNNFPVSQFQTQVAVPKVISAYSAYTCT